MQFRYILVHKDQARIELGERTSRPCKYTITPKQGNGLQAIAQIVCDLLAGAMDQTWEWRDEMGKYRWTFHRRDTHLRIQTFFHSYKSARNKTWEPEERSGCEVMCTVYHFAKQVHHELKVIFQTWGIEGYRQMWQDDDFPLGLFEQLDLQLKR